MKVEIEIPKEVEKEVKRLAEEIDWEKFLSRALAKGVEISLKEKIEMELAFKRLRKLATKSKLTNEQALKLGEKLKEEIAKRHGL